MKKEEIYVVIDSEKKRLRAIQILIDAGEDILKHSELLSENPNNKNLEINVGEWMLSSDNDEDILSKTEITLDQLEELLNPKQEIKLDALKLIAESYGFELVEKKREPKIGDFGKFWDNDENIFIFGFIESIEIQHQYCFKAKGYSGYKNFSHLTEEEKKQIQENW